jgi:UDP:flavonoid glycosyltransferase YjiC (YdhE family)
VPLRILIATEGSEGDNRPPLAVGLRLAAMGHIVKACVPADFVRYFTDRGLEAHPMGLSNRDFFHANSRNMYNSSIGPFKLLHRTFADTVKRQFETLSCHAKDADIILAFGILYGPQSVAEQIGIPLVYPVHSPLFFQTSYLPPVNVSNVHLPRPVNKLLWKVQKSALQALMLKPLNEQRRKIGLEAVGDLWSYINPHMILSMDPEITPFPPDNAQREYTQTAYPLYREQYVPDPVLERFLEAGEPPVFIGFGSVVELENTGTIEIIRDAARVTGVRVIIPSTWAEVEPDSCADRNILFSRRLPHTAIFPRTAGVIHHGGAGTLYTAALAGVPQSAVPHTMDQYYLADRLVQLGLGPALVRKKSLTARNLANAINRMIHETRYRQNAGELGKRLSARNGVDEIVDIILRKAGGKKPEHPPESASHA